MNVSLSRFNRNVEGRNTPIAVPLFIMALISSLLLLLVGGSLFFFPDFARRRWLWTLTPFNTRFLGAIYLTALVALTILLMARRATLARLIVPMMWIFTTIILLVSCSQIKQFDVHRRATGIWFWLYSADCIGASYYLGHYGRQTFSGLRKWSRGWSVYLRLQAVFLGIYGLGLLVLPVLFGGFWPWPLDTYHSQLYSAIFLTGAVGALMLSRQTTAVELLALGLIQVAFSSLVIAGVLVVDGVVHKIDWSLFGNWIWMGAIALLGITGLGMIGQSRQIPLT
ncbi:MAG: hypothetical protein AAFV72_05345 [Cyanobacteria bacterium J06635_1]